MYKDDMLRGKDHGDRDDQDNQLRSEYRDYDQNGGWLETLHDGAEYVIDRAGNVWETIEDFGPNNVGDTERIISAAGGSLLMIQGLRHRSWSGALMAIAGGYLLYRGATGHCPVYQGLGVGSDDIGYGYHDYAVGQHRGIKVDKSVTINKSAEELYSFWRNFENLPQIMSHLESVTDYGRGRSHWVAKGPMGMDVNWDAEIVGDIPNRMISWRSLEGARVPNAGSVRFNEVSDRGTEITVSLKYNPPAGRIGAAVARLFGEEPHMQIDEDLRRFKQKLETGEIATTRGQTSGRKSMTDNQGNDTNHKVTEASKESFPASDPPSFNPGSTTGGRNDNNR